MKLNGREVHFKRTIWATNAITKMCPDGDLQRFNELFNGDTAEQILNMAAFIAIMSEGYEKARAFQASRSGEAYEEDPVTLDEIMALDDMDIFVELQNEAVKAWVDDGKVTVESEPVKTKKKRKAQD